MAPNSLRMAGNSQSDYDIFFLPCWFEAPLKYFEQEKCLESRLEEFIGQEQRQQLIGVVTWKELLRYKFIFREVISFLRVQKESVKKFCHD